MINMKFKVSAENKYEIRKEELVLDLRAQCSVVILKQIEVTSRSRRLNK